MSNWNPDTLSSPDDCVLSPANESVENVCTLYGYDAAGNRITTTNALNQTSLTVYDEVNRPIISIANWDGAPIAGEADCSFPPAQSDSNLCTVTYYDERGRRSAAKDPLGNLSEFGYDGQGRLITTTRYLDGEPVVTLNHYDVLGNRVGQSDAMGHTTTYIYDDLNQLAATFSAEGMVTVYGYDELGQVVTTTNSLGQQTFTDYDALGRRSAITDAKGNVTRYEYDGLGNQVAVTDANGVRTSYLYDGLNRLTAVIENDTGGASTHDSNVLTQYVYDALGNRIVITNALGYTSAQTTYDVLGRPVVVEDALGHQTRTQYNALSHRTVVTNANGSVTRYSYDGLNRLSAVYYASDNVTVTYRYNALGRRVAMTDTLGTTTYDYDDLGRLVSVSDPLTGTVGYGYDLAGNRTQLIYPGSKVVTYTYDSDNRLIQLEDWDGGLTGYTCDAAGRLVSETLPNGVDTTRQYDAAGRLVRLTHTAPDGSILSEYVYELDGIGNRTKATETLTQTTRVITNVYDHLNRLTVADYSSGEQFKYVYDSVGNRTLVTSTTPLSGTVVTTHTFDAANRLIKRIVDGNDTFLYTWSDANQLTQEVWNGYSAVRVFGYDYAGRLITVTLPGLSTTFQYDGDGHRLVKAVNGDPVTYTLDYARNARMLVEHSITSTRHYLYGEQCIGEVNDAAQAWSYYLGDGVGRVRQVSDEAGAIDFAWSYTTLGEVLSGPKGYHVLLDCPDGVYDWSTGLILVNGRYFDPTLGIWIALGPLMMVQLWQGRKKKRRRRIWYALLLVVCVGGGLAACDDSCYEVLKTFSLGGLQDHGMFQNPCKAEGVQLKWDQVYPDETDRVERALNAAFAMYSSPLGFYTPDMAAQELGISAKRPLRLRRETVHPEDPSAPAAAGGGSIFVYNNFFRETGDWDASDMGHEFAHLWDERQNPSYKFSKELKGWINWGGEVREYGHKNDLEDFATSVAAYFWHETAEDVLWTDDFGAGRQSAIAYGAPDAPDQLAIFPCPPSGDPTMSHCPQLTVRGTEGSERVKDRYDYVQMLFGHEW